MALLVASAHCAPQVYYNRAIGGFQPMNPQASKPAPVTGKIPQSANLEVALAANIPAEQAIKFQLQAAERLNYLNSILK